MIPAIDLARVTGGLRMGDGGCVRPSPTPIPKPLPLPPPPFDWTKFSLPG